MSLLEKLEEEPLVSKYLSYYTQMEKFEAMKSTLLYGICSLKLHYNNPLPMTLLNETVRKAKAVYASCVETKPAEPKSPKLRSSSLFNRLKEEKPSSYNLSNELVKKLNSAEWEKFDEIRQASSKRRGKTEFI